jgi:5'-3' exonuclease
MVRLPFVVEPRLKPILERIGNEEVGVFEIERRGYLSVQERNFVQQIEKSDDGTSAVIKLSRKISAGLGIGLERAYNIAIASISISEGSGRDEYQDRVDEEFAEDITEMITSLSQMQAKGEMVQALCMLIHRIDSSITPNDLKDIHPDLITELSKLYTDESNKSTERIKEVQEENQKKVDVAEIEKKSRKKTEDG